MAVPTLEHDTLGELSYSEPYPTIFLVSVLPSNDLLLCVPRLRSIIAARRRPTIASGHEQLQKSIPASATAHAKNCYCNKTL